MPKATVRLPHQGDQEAVLEKVMPAIEKTVADFQGHGLSMNRSVNGADFSFKSMAFSLTGRMEVTASEVVVEVDLPFAAMMFKDKAERAIAKNLKRAIEA